MRVLVVEDDRKGARFLKKGLEEERYVVDVAHDGVRALELAKQHRYDLILLDLLLPGVDGLQVCRVLRERRVNAPIIMITARDSTEEKIAGLDRGADDYLTKPFDFSELLARMRALLRRDRMEKAPVLRVADLELNPLSRRVRRAGRTLHLTAKEYALLEYLMRHAGQVVPRTRLLMHVWEQPHETFTNVVDVTISHLRSKVDAGRTRRLIHTAHGVGYSIEAEGDTGC
ncbi:MAG: response regulator [Acidobacteriota bacterium]